MKEFQITVKDLTSYEGARALSNAPRAVKFFGNHVSDYIFGLGGEGAGVADTAKWVVADKPCSATAALLSTNARLSPVGMPVSFSLTLPRPRSWCCATVLRPNPISNSRTYHWR